MNRFQVGIVAEQLLRRPSGGIGVYIRSLATALAAHEARGAVDTCLITSSGITTEDRAELPVSTPLKQLWTPHRATVELVHRGLPVPGSRRVTLGLDVLHAASLDLLPGKLAMTAFVHDTLWRSWPDAYTARGIAWHERALTRTIDRAKLLMVPSAAVAAELVAFGAAADAVLVVGEGSDHLPVVPRECSGESLTAAGQPSGYLLSVATDQPRKNLAGLVNGYRAYRSAVANPLRLLLVGPAGWGTGLPPLPDGAEVVGNVTDLRLSQLYAGAAALVMVPFAEGYGLPVVEAWRAGSPVICSPGVPVAAEHVDAALIADPTNAEAIAAAIVSTITDPTETQRRVANGLAIASGLTWASVAQRHIDAWRSVLDSR